MLKEKFTRLFTCLLMLVVLISSFTGLGIKSSVVMADGSLTTVYLACQYSGGDDGNDGSSQENAVCTFARAKELLAPDGTIIITGDDCGLCLDEEQTWSLEGYGSAKVVIDSNAGFDNWCAISLECNTLTLENITIDASSFQGEIEYLIEHSGEYATLTVGQNASIIYDNNLIAIDIHEGSLIIDSTAIIIGQIEVSGGHPTIIDNRQSTINTITIDGAITGGTVTADPTDAAEGDTVTLTVTPDTGKQLVADSLVASYNDGSGNQELTLTDNGNGTWSFTMPAFDVTVTAQFEDEVTFIPGDVTGDGIVNIQDVELTVDFVLEIVTPTPEQFRAADCNNDDVINIQDVVLIVNIMLGS